MDALFVVSTPSVFSGLAFITHAPLTLSRVLYSSKSCASSSTSTLVAKRSVPSFPFNHLATASTPIRASTKPNSISMSMPKAVSTRSNTNDKTNNIIHSALHNVKNILRIAVLGLLFGFLSMAPISQIASIRWLNVNRNYPAHAASVKTQGKVKQQNAKATDHKASTISQGLSDTQMTVAGTVIGGALIMLVKTIRSKKDQEVNTKKPEEIKVVRYDKVMEETWKKEDQMKKEEAAKDATDDVFLSDLQKRIKDLNVDQDETALPLTDVASPVEMTDMINSLERLWKEDKDDMNPNGPNGGNGPSGPNNEKKKKKNSGPESRMGSWAGMGSALLEPDKNSSFSTPSSNDGLSPPEEIPTETLNLLRKCWDASADDSNKK